MRKPKKVPVHFLMPEQLKKESKKKAFSEDLSLTQWLNRQAYKGIYGDK